MTLEDFLFTDDVPSMMFNSNTANTRTYARESVSDHIKRFTDEHALIKTLRDFNTSVETLRAKERRELYHSFHIPKKSGGLRRIDAPTQELKDALRRLKSIFEDDFRALYHTSSFAYARGRCTVDAVKRHQANESKWFGKYDLSNFFGSTTLDFVMRQFGMIFPFSEIVKYPAGRAELEAALELAFLNGGLPQGTPISPLITNVMMIPVDYTLANRLRSFEKQAYTYTRYADDFIVSSKYHFSPGVVEKLINDALALFDAPFSIKTEKTRYGSSSGRNWNLGVMLNKDNKITIGHRKKRQFQSMLYNYIADKKRGVRWELHDVHVLNGLYSYYKMVEPEPIEAVVQFVNAKQGVNVIRLIRDDLR
jgi:hypothetical protein